jgi:hypothetical protein
MPTHQQNLRNHAALLLQISKDLIAQADEMAVAEGAGPPPVPVPLPVPDVVTIPAAPKYVYDANRTLVEPPPAFWGPQKWRMDPVIDITCPTGVKVTSGRFLSEARPDLGETFMGYVIRVVQQAGKDPALALSGLGALFLGGDSYFGKFGGFKADGSNWPLAADVFFNGYPKTQAEIDAEASANQQWADHWAAKEAARREEERKTTGGGRHERPTTTAETPPTGEVEIVVEQG